MCPLRSPHPVSQLAMRADPPPPGEGEGSDAHRRPSLRYRWRLAPIALTLALRSCVARQKPYIPGALSILPGTVPGRVRGSGHMEPTYFRRELRDRVLQRPSRLRTFFLFLPSRYFRRSALPTERSKAELRAAALAKRDALSDNKRAAAAMAIAKRGLPIEVTAGTIVSAYSPIRSEIDPAPLMRTLAALGAQLALPAVMARGKSLAFRVWSPDDRLMLGPLGILEPSPGAAEVVPDIMLVPLAAFDRSGHRIGYGAGHYDYTLAHLRKVKAIAAVGLAFTAQEIKSIPALQHDVALDYVLTEARVFDFRSS